MHEFPCRHGLTGSCISCISDRQMAAAGIRPHQREREARPKESEPCRRHNTDSIDDCYGCESERLVKEKVAAEYERTHCPAWADGQHLYVLDPWHVVGNVVIQEGKRCVCGKTVERAP